MKIDDSVRNKKAENNQKDLGWGWLYVIMKSTPTMIELMLMIKLFVFYNASQIRF